MYIGIFVGIVCAVIFFRAADYERLNPWAWALASIGVTGILSLNGAGIPVLLLGQIVLFVAMWGYNMRRQNRKAT